MHLLQTLQLPPSVLCLLKPPGKGPAKGYAQKSVSEFSSENAVPGRQLPTLVPLGFPFLGIARSSERQLWAGSSTGSIAAFPPL